MATTLDTTPTHTGKNSNGRSVLLRFDPISGRYLMRAEYRAIYGGATREWGTYSDVTPISACTVPGCDGSVTFEAKCLNGCRPL